MIVDESSNSPLILFYTLASCACRTVDTKSISSLTQLKNSSTRMGRWHVYSIPARF